MEIYVTHVFDRNMKKHGVDDKRLFKAANEIINGLFDADLGGHVYKKRLPLSAGKRGGARSVVAFRTGERLFFINGWTKNSVDKNQKEIPDDTLEAYRAFAADLLKMSEQHITDAKRAGILREVACYG